MFVFGKNSSKDEKTKYLKAKFKTYKTLERFITNKKFALTETFGSEKDYPDSPKTFQFNAVDEAEMSRKIDSFMGLLLFGVEMEMEDIRVILGDELGDRYSKYDNRIY